MLVHNSDKIYIGETKIKKVYAGNTLVYECQDTPTPPYTALTYIGKGLGGGGSNNAPYIDTGFKPNQDTRVEMKVSNSSHPAYWFGCWNSAYNRGAYACCNDTYNVYSGYDDQGGGSGSYIDDGEHIVNMDKNIVYIDGATFRTFNYTQFQVNYNLHLFGQNRTGNNSYGDMGMSSQTWRVYYCKIWDNGTLIRDFIPVLDENNVACLYDKVSETYFYNNGTGGFIYG